MAVQHEKPTLDILNTITFTHKIPTLNFFMKIYTLEGTVSVLMIPKHSNRVKKKVDTSFEYLRDVII